MARQKVVEATDPVEPENTADELVAQPVDATVAPVRLEKMQRLYALANDPDQQEAFFALRDELNASA